MSETRMPINQIGEQHFAAGAIAASSALTLPTVTSAARQVVTPAHILITANGAAGSSNLFIRFDGTAVTAINGIAIAIGTGTTMLLSLMDANFDYRAMIAGLRMLTSDASALIDVLFFD